MMATIVLRGPWAWIWGAWHVAWLWGLFWVARLGWPAEVDLYFASLYTAFLPLELAGVVARGRGAVVGTTLSEVRQWIAQQGKPGSSMSTSWKALAGVTGAIDAALVTMILSRVDPWVGVVAGFGVALWLMPHFSWREDVG